MQRAILLFAQAITMLIHLCVPGGVSSSLALKPWPLFHSTNLVKTGMETWSTAHILSAIYTSRIHCLLVFGQSRVIFFFMTFIKRALVPQV